MARGLEIYANAYLEADVFGGIGLYGVSGPVEVFKIGYLLHDSRIEKMWSSPEDVTLVRLKYYAVIASLELIRRLPFNSVTIHTDYNNIVETVYRGYQEEGTGSVRGDLVVERNTLLREMRSTEKDIRVHFTDNDLTKKAKQLAIDCVDTGVDVNVNVPDNFRGRLHKDFNDDSPLMA